MAAETNASDIIFHKIYNSIISGEYPPGSRLPSGSSLCERYGVSYVTVRAALQRLVALELVETNTGGGTYVRSTIQPVPYVPFIQMPRSEIWEMLEYRQWMEAEAAGFAAEKATDSEIRHLRQIHDKMLHYHISGMTELYSKADFALHTYISEMAKNSLLKRVLDILSSFFQQQISFSNIYLGRDWGYEEHVMIIQSIEKRNAQAAYFHAWEHIESTMELWKQYWEEHP